MPSYLSAHDGTKVVCGCACGKHRYGNRFTLDISGMATCFCVHWPLPAGDGLYHSIELEDSFPTEFELEYIGGGQWASTPVDVTYAIYDGVDPTCSSPSTGIPGTLSAKALCINDPGGDLDGALLVYVPISNLRPIYAAYFGAPNSSEPSVLECGVTAPGDPVAFPALYDSGDGSISDHEFD